MLMLMFSLLILCDGDLPHCRVYRWPRAGVQTARHQPEQAGRSPPLRCRRYKTLLQSNSFAEDVLNEETFGAETAGEALGTHTSL
jgi:hypothetical protein